MPVRHTGLLRVLLPVLCVAVVACGSNGTEVTRVAPITASPPPTELGATLVAELPTVGLTPEETRTLPEATATESVTVIPATEEPSPTEDILDDLSEELFISWGGAGGDLCWKVPDVLPAVEETCCIRYSGFACVWGFLAGSDVSIELYDPSGQLAAARKVTVDDEVEGVGVAEILLSFAGQSTGDWTIVASSAGLGAEVSCPVPEPYGPIISVVPNGPDLFAAIEPMMDWTQIPFVPGTTVAILGAGFPPGKRLALGIYLDSGDSTVPAKLVYGQEVQTDEQGRFGVHMPVEELAAQGAGVYYAIVPLDPSYRPGEPDFDHLGGRAIFSVVADAGDVPCTLGFGGGFLDDPIVQWAIVIAVNRSHLSTRFYDGRVTFLLSIQGNEPVDVAAEPWDPNLARRLLAEGGYGGGLSTELVYPDGDPGLDWLAGKFADNLTSVGLAVHLVPVPSADLDRYVGNKLAAGEPVLWLVR